MRLTIRNGTFFKECFGWIVEYGRDRCVSVGLWQKSIHMPLLLLFIKIFSKEISLSLNPMVNWIALLREFKVSNNSSGLTFSYLIVFDSHLKIDSNFLKQILEILFPIWVCKYGPQNIQLLMWHMLEQNWYP